MPAALAIALLLALSPPARECECTPASPAEALANADVVFQGKLWGWSKVDDALGQRESWGFKVSRTWKRELPAEAAISIPIGGCPISFGEVGDEWLIYATIKSEEDPEEVRFELAECPRILPLASAADDIAILDGGRACQGCVASDTPDVAAGLGVLCVLGLLRRRRRV